MEQEKCVEINSLRNIPDILMKYTQSKSENDDISLWEDINDQYPHDKFWLFFLSESAKFSMFWLLMNSAFLTTAFSLLLKELLLSSSIAISEDFRFADAVAVLLQLALWNVVSIGGGIFFAVLHYYGPKAIESIFSCNPVIIWIRIGRMIMSLVTMEIFARLSLIDFDLSAHSFGDSRVSQSTLYSLRNCLQVLIDMVQMLILYPLPFPPKYFVAISTVLLAEQLLRLQTRSIHIQDANVMWMYSITRINVIVLWAVMVLYSNVFESSARESYSFIQRRMREAAERRSFVNLLCSDIKVPLQYILLALDNLSNDKVMHVVFQEVKTEAGRSSAIPASGLVLMREVQWLREAVLCDMMLVNWLVDDLLLVMKMKEVRFAFKCDDSVNVKSLFREVCQSIDKLRRYRGDNAEVGDDGSMISLLDAIDVAFPDIIVNTSQQCLSMLVRCFLLFAWRLQEQHKKCQTESQQSVSFFWCRNIVTPLLS
eukprot:gene27965-36835_t